MRFAALALGVSATATWFLQTVSTRVQRRFRDKVTIALEAHVATLLASIPTIAHQERPDYLDRLSVLRNQVFMLDHMYMSLFSTCGWILRLGVTIALLVSIHPALGLLALFALPPGRCRRGARRSNGLPRARRGERAVWRVTCSTWRRRPRLARKCASPVSPIVSIEQRRRAWERSYAPIAAARWASAGWHSLAWAMFGGAYVAAIVFVARARGAGRRRAAGAGGGRAVVVVCGRDRR